jgi:hypothetical protein
MAILYWQLCQAGLFWESHPASPVLPVLFCLSSSPRPVQFWLSFYWLSSLFRPALAVLSSSHVLAALS